MKTATVSFFFARNFCIWLNIDRIRSNKLTSQLGLISAFQRYKDSGLTNQLQFNQSDNEVQKKNKKSGKNIFLFLTHKAYEIELLQFDHAMVFTVKVRAAMNNRLAH